MIVNPETITKIRITDKLPIDNLIKMVEDCDGYVLLADSTYSLISGNDIELDDKEIVIPVVVPHNATTNAPFGKQIRNINIEANLKIQPFFSSDGECNFIPHALIAHKDLLLSLLKRLDYSIFLELSLLCLSDNVELRLSDNWIVSVSLKQDSDDVRSNLSVKYGTMGSLIKPSSEYVSRIATLCNSKMFMLNKYFRIFSGSNILLTDVNSSDIDVLSFSKLVVSINSDVPADYYIALDEEILHNCDLSRTISQISIPSVKFPVPIDARNYGVSAYFGVKQFSSDVAFEPPFTRSTNKILTALEIICYFKPSSITVMSDNIIGSLVAAGDGPESIKRQIFMTKIVDYCMTNNIKFKVFGDLCNLN